jgi:LPXTG-motif cell wall-anchored protein
VDTGQRSAKLEWLALALARVSCRVQKGTDISPDPCYLHVGVGVILVVRRRIAVVVTSVSVGRDDAGPRSPNTGENMDTNTLIVIVLVVLLLGGGGLFYRRRV